MLRVCIDCNDTYEGRKGESRCTDCRATKQRARDAQRGTSKQRGFDYTYAVNRRIVLSSPTACCEICLSRENLTVDHIIPRAKGGTNDLHNLRILCGKCNYSRGSKTDEEFLAAREIGPA